VKEETSRARGEAEAARGGAATPLVYFAHTHTHSHTHAQKRTAAEKNAHGIAARALWIQLMTRRVSPAKETDPGARAAVVRPPPSNTITRHVESGLTFYFFGRFRYFFFFFRRFFRTPEGDGGERHPPPPTHTHTETHRHNNDSRALNKSRRFRGNNNLFFLGYLNATFLKITFQLSRSWRRINTMRVTFKTTKTVTDGTHARTHLHIT